MRIIKTVGLVVGIYALGLISEFIMGSRPNDYQGGFSIVVIFACLGFLSPKVGYRWFDCFLAAIPIYGTIFIFRIAYRIANLPNIDWATRVN